MSKEIVQNFWAAFWENPRILRPNKKGYVKVFLLQYLRFRIYDMYRIADPETISIDETEVLSGTTVYDNIEKEELKEIIRDALKESSPLTKDSFWMRVESMPAKEVASELGVTTQTVYNKFSQSLSTIRKYIKAYYPEIIKSRKG